jgi:hypothetical protein
VDEATLAVVGSIAAALLGSLVGAGINQHAARRLETGRERREAEASQARVRAAARLVFIELQLAGLGAQSALKNKQVVFGIAPPTTAWATHGVLLAEALSEGEYDAVAEACGKVAVWFGAKVPPALQGVTELSDMPDAEQTLSKLQGVVEAAIEVLRPIAYPESAGRIRPAAATGTGSAPPE